MNRKTARKKLKIERELSDRALACRRNADLLTGLAYLLVLIAALWILITAGRFANDSTADYALSWALILFLGLVGSLAAIVIAGVRCVLHLPALRFWSVTWFVVLVLIAILVRMMKLQVELGNSAVIIPLLFSLEVVATINLLLSKMIDKYRLPRRSAHGRPIPPKAK